ncbi:chemotaxis protein CheR [bacterium F16]|nr:chemotaxis protein CheR [bacterium F16]
MDPLSKIDMSVNEFNDIRSLVYDAFGISLAEHKHSLVKSRLQKHLLRQGHGSYRDYINAVKADASGDALATLANRISTNYTYFYRESPHFEFLSKTALPEICSSLNEKGSKDLRMWCAGCSSGQEAYTLQILNMEHLGSDYSQWHAGLLATDISTKALSYAMKAIYPKETVEKLPPKLRNAYFTSIDNENLQVADKVRKEVMFRRFNLMTQNFPFSGKFQVIFCRNVMIYFDRETRDALVERYAQVMAPGGYLFIGHSETLGRDNDHFKYVMPAVYQRI